MEPFFEEEFKWNFDWVFREQQMKSYKEGISYQIRGCTEPVCSQLYLPLAIIPTRQMNKVFVNLYCPTCPVCLHLCTEITLRET